MAISSLSESVQHNCHISDARHGSDYGLCTYLMKMREYYRWENGLGFTDQLPNDAVGDWLSGREALWSELSGSEFQPISVAGNQFDPFDARSINSALNGSGLVYSGGLGRSGKPHFFLGELERRQSHEAFSLVVSGRELARDLAAPPAMTRGDVIYLRRESLRRMLWEKLENWRWSRADNALGRAFACYDFEQRLETSLDAMTDAEIDTVLLHEQGEQLAGTYLGSAWEDMLVDLLNTSAELTLRAVRDHLADCLVTLPRLVEQGQPASMHFFMGNLTAMRKQLFPALLGAYDRWRSDGDADEMAAMARRGVSHWRDTAEAMLALHAERGAEACVPITELAESSKY